MDDVAEETCAIRGIMQALTRGIDGLWIETDPVACRGQSHSRITKLFNNINLACITETGNEATKVCMKFLEQEHILLEFTALLKHNVQNFVV